MRWSPEPRNASSNAPQGLPDEYKPFVSFIAITGLRLGEARSIKWQDIDLESGKLQVSRSIRRARLKEPKTEANKRPLILPVELVNVCRYLRRVYEPRERV